MSCGAELTCRLVKKQNCAAVAMREALSPTGLWSSCAISCSKSPSEMACACTCRQVDTLCCVLSGCR